MFSLYSHGILGVVFTKGHQWSTQWKPRSLKSLRMNGQNPPVTGPAVLVEMAHDACLANSRVRAIKRVELFSLGDGSCQNTVTNVVKQLVNCKPLSALV